MYSAKLRGQGLVWHKSLGPGVHGTYTIVKEVKRNLAFPAPQLLDYLGGTPLSSRVVAAAPLVEWAV